MIRDMDLIRELLLKIEALDLPQGATMYAEPADPELLVDGYTPDQIAYNLDLLFDGGFVRGDRAMAHFGITGLTWQGHELLDDIRDPEVWGKTKTPAKAVAGIGVQFLWEIAKAEVKAKLGLP
jgi:Hypothetical protein (DUF2513)